MPGIPTSEAQASWSGLRAFYQQLLNAAFDLVFPSSCAGCGRVDSVWCTRCKAELAAIPLQIRSTKMAGGVAGRVAVTGVHTGKLQEAVQALKYDQVTTLSLPLGKRLTAALHRLDWQPDIVIPVPLHRARLSERGYNQAYLLAQEVARTYNLPCLPDAARRERRTRSQVGLNRDERLQNVMNAFTADPAQCSRKIVLIVDDVLTTGATLSACASAVLSAGATAVYGLTVCAARD